MKLRSVVSVLGAVAVIAGLGLPVRGAPQSQTLPPAPGATGDWPLHNRDLYNARYSPLTDITASNVDRLTMKWSFPAGANIGEVTPLVLDGVMYVNSGSRLFALDGATGAQLWTVPIAPAFPGSGRGPASGDNRIYAYGAMSMYAVEAKTGRPIEAFEIGRASCRERVYVLV